MNRLQTVRATLAAALLAGVLGACADRDVASVENGLWKMFAGHPKPIILEKPPPPVYCYRTLGAPQCYAEPLPEGEGVPIR